LKREIAYVALALILAVAATSGYYEITNLSHTGPLVANQIFRETTEKAQNGFAARTTFIPIMSVTVFLAAFVCACLTYSVTKKRFT
jgi:hypothetical protein